MENEPKPTKVNIIHGGESRETLRKGVSDGAAELREGYKPAKPQGVVRPLTYPIPPAPPPPKEDAGGEKKK